jgi:LDH2 family malate/lactate/ureidoglycolate dehydrogenase
MTSRRRSVDDLAGRRIMAERVSALGVGILTAAGAPRPAAAVQVEQLVEADLRGRPSHGMQRLPTLAERIRNGVLDPAAVPCVAGARGAAIVIGGGFGFGPVAARAAVAELRRVARAAGVAVAAIQAAGHLGMLAPYLEDLAADGLVGLGFATSEALVHPAGGRTPLVGTNPIAIAVPARPHPFVLDMSTAAISAGEVIARADRRARLPCGRAVDAGGRPTTDPVSALRGAISPFGGPKGYGLGLGIELVVAALTGCALGTRVRGTLDVECRSTKGDVLVAADPAWFGSTVGDEQLGAYLDEVRNSPTAPGVERILIPGDRMRAERERRIELGIPYPRAVWARLLALELATRAGTDG